MFPLTYDHFKVFKDSYWGEVGGGKTLIVAFSKAILPLPSTLDFLSSHLHLLSIVSNPLSLFLYFGFLKSFLSVLIL